MKKVIGCILILCIIMASIPVHSIVFLPGTIFLQADNKNDCEEIGGSFTKWYSETRCTTHFSLVLSEQEQLQIELVGEIIFERLNNDAKSYEYLMGILEEYRSIFQEKYDTKRKAIAISLIMYIQHKAIVLLDTCNTRSTGCNMCVVDKDNILSCTNNDTCIGAAIMPHCMSDDGYIANSRKGELQPVDGDKKYILY